MARRRGAPSPCKLFGCPWPVHRDGLCLDHWREARRDSDRRRPGGTARGYDHRWAQTSRAFLLAHPTCEGCGAPSEHADHVDGLGPNGPRGHDWSNLRALCASCHARRTARDQPGGWNRR